MKHEAREEGVLLLLLLGSCLSRCRQYTIQGAHCYCPYCRS